MAGINTITINVNMLNTPNKIKHLSNRVFLKISYIFFKRVKANRLLNYV